MVENIFAGFLGALVLGAGVWAWFVDNRNNSADTEKDEEKDNKKDNK